jgi:hypothetical protein
VVTKDTHVAALVPKRELYKAMFAYIEGRGSGAPVLDAMVQS